MNIQDINTPSDLVAANTEVNHMEVAAEALSHCGPQDSMKVLLWLTHNMKEWHSKMTEDENSSLAWARDYGRLEVAMEILKSIEV